jgi:hypothetical protein
MMDYAEPVARLLHHPSTAAGTGSSTTDTDSGEKSFREKLKQTLCSRQSKQWRGACWGFPS